MSQQVPERVCHRQSTRQGTGKLIAEHGKAPAIENSNGFAGLLTNQRFAGAAVCVTPEDKITPSARAAA
jgi:hypothetical protein